MASEGRILFNVAPRREERQQRRMEGEVGQRLMRIDREHSAEAGARRDVDHAVGRRRAQRVEELRRPNEVARHRIVQAKVEAKAGLLRGLELFELLRKHERRNAATAQAEHVDDERRIRPRLQQSAHAGGNRRALTSEPHRPDYAGQSGDDAATVKSHLEGCRCGWESRARKGHVDAIRELEKDSDLRRDRLQCVGGTFKIDAEHNERGVERRW